MAQQDKAAILRSLEQGAITFEAARSALEGILAAERAARLAAQAPQPPEVSASSRTAIAIIGLSGRFPDAPDAEALWRNLATATTSVTQAPTDRGWDVLDHFDPRPQTPGKTYVCKGCFLDGFAEFDPLFFGISPRDAARMDPAERLFLQEAWRAVEDAGYGPERVSGQAWGVFAAAKGDYESYIQQDEPTYFLGTESFAAARLSYLLHLVGPAVAIDTACSSTLVAIAQACDNLVLGNCQVAIAGGASVYSTPTTLISSCQSLLFSPDACCRTFDADANGTVLGEGVGAVVLKPLADAERDGDAIRGVIRGWGVNQDGRTNGITAPSATAQADLQATIYARFGIDPDTITLVEAHGTGTALGDPIEVAALTASFRRFTTRRGYCALGSLKPNIGHTFFAAGIASTIKVMLCLAHRQIPPSINFSSLNERIALTDSPFYVTTSLQDWTVDGYPRRAAINAFGLTGTNAHIVIDEYAPPTGAARREGPLRDDAPARVMVIPVSAQDDARLAAYGRALCDVLERIVGSTEVSPGDRPSLAQIAYTLQVGRRALDVRLVILASSIVELRARLMAAASGAGASVGILRGRVDRRAPRQNPADVEDAIRAGDAERIGRAWVDGADVDWARLWEGRRPGTCHLPTYPFAREHCWFPRHGYGARGAGAATAEETSPREDVLDVEVASIEQSSGKNWLCFTERWAAPAASRPAIDWRAYARPGRGANVLVISADEADVLDVGDALRQQLATSAPADLPRPVVRWLTFTDLDSLASPDIVFVLLASETTAEREAAHLDVVLRLCRELMTHWWERPLEVYVCCASGSEGAATRDEAWSGLLRSAMLENPRHRYHVVHHDASGAARARDLVAESLCRDVDVAGPLPLVRYDAGLRTASVYEERLRIATSGGRGGLRPDHTYLIAGGLGEVGTRLCLQLAAEYRCTLVLVSRRPPDGDAARVVADLRATGARVHYFSADVADEHDMAAVYARIKQQVGRIDGVLHLARTVDDGPVLGKNVGPFQAAIAAKVRGTEVLDDLTRDEPLAFFVMFSSMAAFGLAGAADYAYACAFQNAFARARNLRRARGTRQGHSLALCWGQWDADRYIDAARRAAWRARGGDVIDAASALRVIEACLNSREDVLGWVAVSAKARARQELTIGGTLRPSEPSTTGRAALRAALEGLPDEELRAFYAAAVAAVASEETTRVNDIA